MMHDRHNSIQITPAFLVVIVLLSSLVGVFHWVHAEIYQWKDSEGNLHFTDDPGKVPQGMRDRLKEVPLPQSHSTAEQQPPAHMEESEEAEAGDSQTAEARRDFEEEVSRWQKRLDDDSAALQELNRSIRRTHTARKRNLFQGERVRLEDQILEDKKMLEEVLPNKGIELGIE